MKKLCLLFFGFITSFTITAGEYLVATPAEYQRVAEELAPGDTVILKNGVWTDFEIVFSAKGTKNAPVSLTAEEKGKVILSGQSDLKLAGEYLHVSGLVFKNGFAPGSAVIEFRDGKELASYSRVSEVVIDNYNNPDRQESDYWVALYGKHNRFDHSHLAGKRNKGVTVAVRLNSEASQENYHQIDHNYFGFRPVFGSNGGETLRIGTSHYSLTDSFTNVSYNYFDQTNGEVEIISVKSGKNSITNNVFNEARGTLTLRHGNGNIVEDNVFTGNGKEHTGGIRVINKNQIIKNNYLEGLTGYRFGSGFTVMNGVPDSPVNRYHQVENAQIAGNTFINVDHIQFAAGSDAERTATPVNSVFTQNLVLNQNGTQPFTVFDDVSGIRFSENVTNTDVLAVLRNGFSKQEVALERADNGLRYPADDSLKAGINRDIQVITKEDTGVAWYPKLSATTAFDSGETVTVAADADALISAIDIAEDGDVIHINAGKFVVPRIVKINKVITLTGAGNGKTEISFERSTLFEIHDGGSLKLTNLSLNGAAIPDAAGNSVVRTKKWGMLHNYRFVTENVSVTQLDINHTFHFFLSGKGAFADSISIANSNFRDITGDILVLNTEIEDLGIYNAEYVSLTKNILTNVAGAVVKLYRGGTDESTFGPHLSMTGNTLRNVGKGKRNKMSASVYLHGVQVTEISDNQFDHSEPVIVEHTVGEPQTEITSNIFKATADPKVKELNAEGGPFALIENNSRQAQ